MENALPISESPITTGGPAPVDNLDNLESLMDEQPDHIMSMKETPAEQIDPVPDHDDLPEEDESPEENPQQDSEENASEVDPLPPWAELSEADLPHELVASERAAGNWLFGRPVEVQSTYLNKVEPELARMSHQAGELAAMVVDQFLGQPLLTASQQGKLDAPMLAQTLDNFRTALSREMSGLVAFTGVHTSLSGLDALAKQTRETSRSKAEASAIEQDWFEELGSLQDELGRSGKALQESDLAQATEDMQLFLKVGLKPKDAIHRALRSYRRGIQAGREVERQHKFQASTRRGHANAHRATTRAPKSPERDLMEFITDPSVSYEQLEEYANSLKVARPRF